MGSKASDNISQGRPFTWWTKSSPPLWLLLIFWQCLQVFASNFTQLLSKKIYTSPPSSVKISENEKKCDVSTKSTFISQHHAELSKLSQVHWEEWVAPYSQDLNVLDYHVWAPCWKSTIYSSQAWSGSYMWNKTEIKFVSGLFQTRLFYFSFISAPLKCETKRWNKSKVGGASPEHICQSVVNSSPSLDLGATATWSRSSIMHA